MGRRSFSLHIKPQRFLEVDSSFFLPEWVSEEHVQAAISKAVSKGVLLAQHIQLIELSE